MSLFGFLLTGGAFICSTLTSPPSSMLAYRARRPAILSSTFFTERELFHL